MLDWTQAELAQQVNCSLSMLRKIERDQRRPSEQLAGLLADALSIEAVQRDQFVQMARGQFMVDMPQANGPDLDQVTAVHSAEPRTVFGNPFIISSGAILLLFFLLLLFGGLNDRSIGTFLSGEEVPANTLAGRTVVVEVGSDAERLELLRRSLTPFEEQTGIELEIRTIPDAFEVYIAGVADVGNPPDIVTFPQPGYLADFARQGQLVALDSFLDDAYLRQQYSETFLDLGTIDGRVYGAPHTANLKGLVWYAKDDFEAAGYEVPETWAELMALSEKMIGDGQTPWCIGIEFGTASGWIGTDWVEALLLRTAPPETYDAWVAGELPFDSPQIQRVFALMAPIWLDEAMVYGGKETMMETNIFSAGVPLFDDPPGCLLNKGATFSPGQFPEDAVYGQDHDFFMLPAIDEAYGEPLLGAGELYAMFNDRPEVRELMRFLTTGESIKPFAETGKFVSAHRDVPLEWYTTPLQLRYAQLIAEADTYRFDGSDMMPGDAGFQFWQGIVDWVEGEELDKVLQEIDESWPE